MSDFPVGDAFTSTTVVRAWEPPEEVVVPFALAHSEGLQPEDYGVLLRLLLRDPQRPSSVLALSEEFQTSGWKMGEKRLREVMKRLKAAGHVQHLREYNPSTKRPEWQFRVFRNPANNAAYTRHGGDSFPQVRPIGRKPADRGSDAISDPAETGVCAGQTDRAEIGGSAPIRRIPADRSEDVSAGQTDRAEIGGSDVAPPTPPRREEEDSSSRKSSSTTLVAAGAQATDAAAVTAAVEFLAELPGRWACGRKTATELGPLLAESVAAQGWGLGSDLSQQLTRRSQARRSAQAVLRERIEDLPRYRAARKALEQERTKTVPLGGEQQPSLPEVQQAGPGAAELPSGVTAELVERAREFLLTLTGPWALGTESAARLAPLLAGRVIERGWEFDQVLLAQLMSNPGGANNHELVLERNRIGCLPFRRKTAPGQQRDGRNARQEAIDACTVCDAYGQYEINGRAALCKHDGTPAPAVPQDPPAGAACDPAPVRMPEPAGEANRLESLLAAMRQPAV
ncbi:hypothetical protein [Streptomyces sp. NPDC057429]|uniref:hypothetical protein n=1 Tax=Streptomyces sp. NPDC057429 TaxID=3346130 RepID=UPI00369920C4